MSDYISATLQEGSAAVAMAARPSGPEVIRARGDRRGRRNAAGLAVAALAVVAVGAGAYPLVHLSTAPAAPEGAGSIMPRVTGDRLGTAEHAIVRAGLSVGHVIQRHSDVIPPGLVIATSPRYGTAEHKGAGVSIVVSAGGGTVVPEVVGMTEPQAEQLLLALQMQVEVRSATSPTSIPGTVTSESPAAGSEVARGSVIVLYVDTAKRGS